MKIQNSNRPRALIPSVSLLNSVGARKTIAARIWYNTSMHRLLTKTAELSADTPRLSREALQHLKVLRLRMGEEVELFDGKGQTRLFVFEGEGRLKPCGDLQQAPAVSAPITLFACVTKGTRWDWTLEKATELGVSRIVPVLSARTIVKIPASERAAKQARWQKILEEAARQSQAVYIPKLLEPIDFEASLALVKGTNCFVGALTQPPSPPILRAIQATSSPLPPALYVGPEGDFTPEELAALLTIATPTSFGTSILRAETAAVFGLSILKGIIS